MRKLIESTSNFTKKDMINCRNGFSLQDLDANEVITVNKAAIVIGDDKDSQDGERQVAVLMDAEGTCYTSISENVLDSMSDIIEVMDEEKECRIKVFKRKSKQGRDFISLAVL